MCLKELLKIACQIKDSQLRAKVIDILKNPSLSNTNLKYKPANIDEVPASLNWHHIQTGGLVEHTLAVTKLAIAIGQTLKDVYKMAIDMDSLIAAAILHDIGKIWSMQKVKGWLATNITLDHTILGTAELYARGFPERVLHIVASHFGEQGPTPPQTIEAIILHYADSLDAVLNGKQNNILKLIID
jgi:7,8-dihydroneopterin 2',3'-cyclic phosphate phosphodiesterase